MGPLSPALKALAVKQRSDIKFDIDWTTLGEYLELLERRGDGARSCGRLQ